MHYLLVLWMSAYGLTSTLSLHEFDSQAQCEAIGQHIQRESANLRSYECLPLNGQTARIP